MTETTPIDHRYIVKLVENGSTVLDLGCGDGSLLALLVRQKKVKAQGIEINQKSIMECVTRGLSVFYGDLDSGLADFADQSVDYIILNQTLQQVLHPDQVLNEALRVGKKVIVGFPNFAHFTARLYILFWGRAPITPALPYRWYESPNLHFLSIRDFSEYCQERGLQIERGVYLAKNRKVILHPNLFAHNAILVISNQKS